MVFTKHVEIDSSFRDRNQWANPLNFSIPTINTQNVYSEDPVCDSAPIKTFVPLPKIVNVSLSILKDHWNICVSTSSIFALEQNAYRGTYISGREIKESHTKNDGKLLLIRVETNVPHAGAFIDTKTKLENGILHLPTMSKRDGLYSGYYIVNETIGGKAVIQDYVNHTLFFNPIASWKMTHTFTIRLKYDVMRRRLTSLPPSFIEFNSDLPLRDANCFIRIISSGKLLRVLDMETKTKARVFPFVPGYSEEPCEVMLISRDNSHPFNFIGTDKVYMMSVTGITLPNIRLANNTNLFDITQICIDVLINKFNSKVTTYGSNNPHILKSSFLIRLPILDRDQPHVYFPVHDNPSIETNMAEICEIRVICRDKYGNELVPLQNDYESPSMPNPETQLGLSLKFVST